MGKKGPTSSCHLCLYQLIKSRNTYPETSFDGRESDHWQKFWGAKDRSRGRHYFIDAESFKCILLTPLGNTTSCCYILPDKRYNMCCVTCIPCTWQWQRYEEADQNRWLLIWWTRVSSCSVERRCFLVPGIRPGKEYYSSLWRWDLTLLLSGHDRRFTPTIFHF